MHQTAEVENTKSGNGYKNNKQSWQTLLSIVDRIRQKISKGRELIKTMNYPDLIDRRNRPSI